jgi:hypothetical protein
MAREKLKKGDGLVHVYPNGPYDGERHICDGLRCACAPQRLPDEPRVVVHQRFV